MTEQLTRPLVLPNLLQLARDPATEWEPLREGIEVHWLYRTPARGPRAALVRYAPGAKLERHSHDGYEHICVLSGGQSDENGDHRAGALLIHPPGTAHTVRAPEGCIVLAIWERPVVFDTSGHE